MTPGVKIAQYDLRTVGNLVSHTGVNSYVHTQALIVMFLYVYTHRRRIARTSCSGRGPKGWHYSRGYRHKAARASHGR